MSKERRIREALLSNPGEKWYPRGSTFSCRRCGSVLLLRKIEKQSVMICPVCGNGDDITFQAYPPSWYGAYATGALQHICARCGIVAEYARQGQYGLPTGWRRINVCRHDTPSYFDLCPKHGTLASYPKAQYEAIEASRKKRFSDIERVRMDFESLAIVDPGRAREIEDAMIMEEGEEFKERVLDGAFDHAQSLRKRLNIK